MKQWIKMGLILAFLSMSVPMLAHAEGEEAAADKETFITNFQSTKSSLVGSAPTSNFYFKLLDYWDVDQVTLNLDYNVSQLTKNEASSITISVNGTKFYSFRPTESTQERQSLTLEIPKDLLRKGENELKVEGVIVTKETQNVCSVTQSAADWLHIYNGSNVGVAYTKQPMSTTIQQFNSYFGGMDTTIQKKVAVLVPDKANETELQSAVYALSGYAKKNETDGATIPVSTFSDTSSMGLPYTIVVAEYKNLPTEYQSKIDAEKVEKDAVIQLLKIENKAVLIVTSNDPKALIKAGRFVANDELMSQISSDQKVVTTTTETASQPLKINDELALTKTGDEVRGAGHQEKKYFMSLPANRSIAENSEVNLAFRYAKNLDFDRSLVTVSINDIPIGSKKLNKEYADSDTVSFKMPADLSVVGNYTVTVSFDLEMKSVPCVADSSQTPWAYIAPESTLLINTQDRTDLLFQNYPFPFLQDGSYNQIGIVLPDKMDQNYYQSLTNVINLLGNYAEDNTGIVKFFPTTATKADLKNYNLILMGSPKDNPVIKSLNKELYFQYDKVGNGFVSNEKLSIESDYGKQIGTGQLIHSPYNEGSGALILTGATSESVYLASKEMASQTSVSKHSGDAFVIDKDKNSYAYRFKKSEDIGEKKTFVEKVQKNSTITIYLLAVTLVGISVIVGLFLAFRKNRKMKGDYDEK
ncbi:cellulose biosynthesis cyclic di-GMP-binding regulatory protein BcsB [Carnobacterium divergens]|uniref:cellulose biosynthesis cyclic di-GMP-binding regulatory protein BcsB n=1 Tax=Carnobacterium divergens TaxID=2748 RepID=UPI00288E58AE|nr:cellulose biosynthesis cyclic di-GMP-binding regulatory protein BcsB [Carnobacterium divergens]MDT2012261.1 cellulose biosynthesis cyclic di-GMP-binding regulatory protein BcsB [Carnobacterium divergens]